jgi:enoyl-[acyl-carrier protein] reductase I
VGFLKGKKALIIGLASNRSIAYGIAEAFSQQGAELAFTYQSERLKERVEEMALSMNSRIVYPCDVSSDAEITTLFENLKQHWDSLDILIHSVAFAPADQIGGDYLEMATREGFLIAHDISAYSLVGLSKAAYPLMQNTQGAILTLTYYGAEKAVPNYNVMGIAKASLEASVRYLAASLGPKGIRVNAISAGPIKTLAAAGIKDFRKIQTAYANITPLKRNITALEVGNAAAFLCSDLASGITGEIVHVDAGYHAVSCADIGE